MSLRSGSDAGPPFGLSRPASISVEHWNAIHAEAVRLRRALDAADGSQAIGDAKCLVEAVSKVTLAIDGVVLPANASYPDTVKDAHRRLAPVTGAAIASGGSFGKIANSARSIVVQLAEVRNEYGGGHGRARLPNVMSEMVELTIDAALLWVRWDLRRLDAYASGRPQALIRELVGGPDGSSSAVFRSGELAQRLRDADLGQADARDAQAIGVAVGQRAARGTFNVRIDGVEPVATSADIEVWPPSYRIGVASGLLWTPDERPSITIRNLLDALRVLASLQVADEAVRDWLARITATLPLHAPISVTREDLDVAFTLSDKLVRSVPDGSDCIRAFKSALSAAASSYEPEEISPDQ